MNRERFKEYLVMLSILAVLTAVAIVGMLQIFNAADESRNNIKVAQCQNVVLGDFIHHFHLAIAQIEAAENNSKEKNELIKEALNEQDIAAAMLRCEH